MLSSCLRHRHTCGMHRHMGKNNFKKLLHSRKLILKVYIMIARYCKFVSFQEGKVGSNRHTSVKTTQRVIIILLDVEKSFNKGQRPFMMNRPKETSNRRNVCQHKGYGQHTYSHLYTQWKRLIFSSKIRRKTQVLPL